MAWLKEFSGKQIYDLDDQDVLDFLIFKDVKSQSNHGSRISVAPEAYGTRKV